jgi:hypothetical protein
MAFSDASGPFVISFNLLAAGQFASGSWKFPPTRDGSQCWPLSLEHLTCSQVRVDQDWEEQAAVPCAARCCLCGQTARNDRILHPAPHVCGFDFVEIDVLHDAS